MELEPSTGKLTFSRRSDGASCVMDTEIRNTTVQPVNFCVKLISYNTGVTSAVTIV